MTQEQLIQGASFGNKRMRFLLPKIIAPLKSDGAYFPADGGLHTLCAVISDPKKSAGEGMGPGFTARTPFEEASLDLHSPDGERHVGTRVI